MCESNASASFCASIPKVELHAHLSGCVRRKTLFELETKHEAMFQESMTWFPSDVGSNQVASVGKDVVPTLDACFMTFDRIHRAIRTVSDVARITREAIEDFGKDNVKYLELRTTPRCLEGGVGPLEYVQCVLTHAKEESMRWNMVVRFLLSIDRGKDISMAQETIRLAVQHMKDGVVGIDLSGDPRMGDMKELIPCMQRARDLGLKVSIHCAEVRNDEDTSLVLGFRPDRLGHCCNMSPEHMEQLLESNIPVELCMTSNVISGATESYSNHHVGELRLRRKHPVVICTDDPGVFCTTLTQEYFLLMSHFSMDIYDLIGLAEEAVDCIFEQDEIIRSRLTEVFRTFRERRGLTIQHKQ